MIKLGLNLSEPNTDKPSVVLPRIYELIKTKERLTKIERDAYKTYRATYDKCTELIVDIDNELKWLRRKHD